MKHREKLQDLVNVCRAVPVDVRRVATLFNTSKVNARRLVQYALDIGLIVVFEPERVSQNGIRAGSVVPDERTKYSTPCSVSLHRKSLEKMKSQNEIRWKFT